MTASSFGGGALLAALTIDLAGPALAKGHFNWLATGCVSGGLLFVIEEGSIDLLDPKDGMKPLMRLQKNDAFGHNALLTGYRHAPVAKAHGDGSLLTVPRAEFERIVTESDALQENLCAFLEAEDSDRYLRERQGLSDEAIQEWKAAAIEAVRAGMPVSPAVPSHADEPNLREVLEQVSRIPMKAQLSAQLMLGVRPLVAAFRPKLAEVKGPRPTESMAIAVSIPRKQFFVHARAPRDRT